jgi:hypothetical protein
LSKHINSKTFIIETRAALGISQDVAIGISYHTITKKYGKKPPFNPEDSSLAAIHLDIDERYYMISQQKAALLWRKDSKQRLPNGVQLHLIPCFLSGFVDALVALQKQGKPKLQANEKQQFDTNSFSLMLHNHKNSQFQSQKNFIKCFDLLLCTLFQCNKPSPT